MLFEWDTYERVIISDYVLDALSGNMSSEEARMSFDIEDKVALSEEEQELVDYVQQGPRINFDEDKAEEQIGLTEIELTRKEARLIRNGFQLLDRMNAFLRDRRFLALNDTFRNQIDWDDG